MKADARRKVVDKVAAAVMLQAWLDGRSSPTRRRPTASDDAATTPGRSRPHDADPPTEPWRRSARNGTRTATVRRRRPPGDDPGDDGHG